MKPKLDATQERRGLLKTRGRGQERKYQREYDSSGS